MIHQKAIKIKIPLNGLLKLKIPEVEKII